MEKRYKHKDHEEKIYKLWEESGGFSPITKGEPYTILMPPPNANASLHAGHAMYTVEDVLIRWKRMQGYSTTWIPGMDHAGFETQFVYEKHLAKQNKSRMDFDRKTLYQDIFDFVKKNSGLIYQQFKRLGFSADWEKSVFTLDDHVIKKVFKTFKKMESEGKVYRDSYIVNYCTHCGTSLAELEVNHIERLDPLYYVRYPLVEDKSKFIVVATVRPEPIFVDTHLAVNPTDKKNKHLIGKKVLNPLTGKEMVVIEDDYVDPEFGTGVVKLTPAHDPHDFEVAKKHGLPIVPGIGVDGKILVNGNKYQGMSVKKAREAVAKDLKKKGLIEKTDKKYTHSVAVCYRCKRDLEPMIVPNWFVKVDKLKKPVIKAVKEERVRFYPKRYKKQMLKWLDIMHDWPISRQIAWGIRLPVWYSLKENPTLQISYKKSNGDQVTKSGEGVLKENDLDEAKKGLQQLRAPVDAQKYVISDTSPGKYYLQETDTFDTWFSSGQWPLVTLKKDEFESRYPTDLMGTLDDILKFWISRMMMFGIYLRKDVPFKDVYLWSMVADKRGVKMSKSKGNVINPIELVDKYGADALRMSVIYGTPAGSKVILSDDKVRGMRNFSNKIWNIGRFIQLTCSNINFKSEYESDKRDGKIKVKLNNLVKHTTFNLENYRLDKASEIIYDFIWNEFASKYLEENKNRLKKKNLAAQLTLLETYKTCLKLLHPFMPFVTEAVWGELQEEGLIENNEMLMNSSWPK